MKLPTICWTSTKPQVSSCLNLKETVGGSVGVLEFIKAPIAEYPRMPTSTESRASMSQPEDYFRDMSSMNRRILDDMSSVQKSWGDQWHQLSYQQQCKVLDQAIVDEETVRRYDSRAMDTGPEVEYFPKLKMPSGQKVVCDESLTARGFTCSWRDEHSAPFSWHTRSQMDLTIDTPPSTPTQPSTPTESHPTTSVEGGESRVLSGERAVYTAKTARPMSLPRPPRFRWHYDIPLDPPSVPEVVVEPPKATTLPPNADEIKKKGKYMLVRGKADNSSSGFLSKLKNAMVSLTATCLPLKPPEGQILTLHEGSPSGEEPDLRPPHVKSQAASTEKNTKCVSSPFSDHMLDPTLSGYVCSLPEDECDDMPYTRRADLSPTKKSKETQKHIPRTSVSATKCSPTPPPKPARLHNPANNGNNSEIQKIDLREHNNIITPSPMSLPLDSNSNANMPQTTTSGDSFDIATIISDSIVSTPTTLTYSPSHTVPTTISHTASMSTLECGNEEPEDKEEPMDIEEDEEEIPLNSSVLDDEEYIPKTGFDFLDNW
ncbi:unnamed protein product [Meganyctiphanes norvegica]|uniref:DUF4706 domain-containing protein n=1 Tax=Meganyctiphanes norvegica TaxID=48144 RepID=A0AAV2QQX1_MEGNR